MNDLRSLALGQIYGAGSGFSLAIIKLLRLSRDTRLSEKKN